MDVTKWTDRDIIENIKDTIKLPIAKIRKNQDIVSKEIQQAYKDENYHALQNLDVMFEIYRIAVDIKEFGDIDIEDYVDDVKAIIKKKYESIKGMKRSLIKKRFKEAQNMELNLVYVNATDSVSVKVNEKNYKNVDKIEKDVYTQFLKIDPLSSDDFWIDDAWMDAGKNSIDLTFLFGQSRLDQDLVDNIFDKGSDWVLIMEFLKNFGYGTKQAIDMVEDVYTMGVSGSNIVYRDSSSQF